MSELNKICGNKILICCFGGMALKMGGILPFEFVRYLSSIYTDVCDLLFYIDKNRCCYHRGIDGISNNIEDTVGYLNRKISSHKYDKIIFMGVSAGGYASILFGSLCNNVSHVISFIPKVKLNNPVNTKYMNLKEVVNSNTNTKYILFADKSITNIHDHHHISQCEILESFTNVSVIKKEHIDLKNLRDTGVIKNVIDSIIYT
jgi:hypothetical protein